MFESRANSCHRLSTQLLLPAHLQKGFALQMALRMCGPTLRLRDPASPSFCQNFPFLLPLPFLTATFSFQDAPFRVWLAFRKGPGTISKWVLDQCTFSDSSEIQFVHYLLHFGMFLPSEHDCTKSYIFRVSDC